VLPADQRLDADHRALAHIDLGLVVQTEFAIVEGALDARHALAVTAHPLVVLGIEQVNAVTPLLLGHVHRLVGMTQQGIRIGTVAGNQCVTDAAGNHRGHPVQTVG